VEQALRMRRGSDDSTTRPAKVPYMASHPRRGTGELSRRYKKDPQHEPRSNGGYPPNLEDQAPGPIQDNSMRIAYREQEKRR